MFIYKLSEKEDICVYYVYDYEKRRENKNL